MLSDLIIYLKFSLRALARNPGINTLYSLLKYYGNWNKFHKPGKTSVADSMPWISFSAIDYLNKIYNPEMLIFEYGSGGSTLFWASRVKHVVSVEHDSSWYFKMKHELTDRGIQNVEYYILEPENDEEYNSKSSDRSNDYISGDKSFQGKKFESYVKQIDNYPNGHFDIIVIDGRARPSCIAHSIKKLKLNGYLIIDNTEREYYLRHADFKKNEWLRKDFFGPVPYLYHFSQTTFLKKLT